jgi:hypothetical protein
MGLHIVRQTVIGVLLLMALMAELTILATADLHGVTTTV